MKRPFHPPALRCQRMLVAGPSWIAAFAFAGTALAASADLSSLVADRTAVERVYYAHRLGQKPPFEQVSPPALIERLVKADRRREAALERVYGVLIDAGQIAAEVQRINATTRAPEMLAEIQAALGNDPERFARTFVRPIVVERQLRDRFENDDALHAPQRRLAEAVRTRMLAADASDFGARLAAMKTAGEGKVQEQVTWDFAPRPESEVAVGHPAPLPTPPPEPTSSKARGGVYAIEATVQPAQVLSAPGSGRSDRAASFAFADLPPRMQAVLGAQLIAAGSVSAVIEQPAAFQVFLARERSPARLSVAILTIPKRSLDQWLEEQPDS